MVDSISFFDAKPGLVTKNITIVDSQSFFVKSPPYELRTTNHYIAPKVLFGWETSFRSVVWALGCRIYEMRAGFPLFITAMYNPPIKAVAEIIVLFEKKTFHPGRMFNLMKRAILNEMDAKIL